MKRNLSLLKEILQLRLDAEIAAATRELNYAHGTERQLSDTTIPTGFEMQRARRHILREIDRVLCQIGPAKQEQA